MDEIDDWESEPFDGGYARLHALADEEFSGVVKSMTATLCFLNGTPVGVLDGSVEDFEEGGGTVSRAPSPGLPLLALMQERSDEVRAKYYSEDTSMSEVDSTLTDGKFSGYIELSENVLSGDYYVVYHAGRSMAVAYVGNSGQLLTDDEAFERADDEVGIYEVRPVEVDPVDIPEPEGGATASVAADPGPANANDGSTSRESGGVASPNAASEGTDAATAGDEGRSTEQSGASDREADTSERVTASRSTSSRETRPGGSETRTAETGRQSQSTPGGTGSRNATGRADAGTVDRDRERDAGSADAGAPARLETRSVPSLDPASTTSDRSRDSGGPDGAAGHGGTEPDRGRKTVQEDPDPGRTAGQEQSRQDRRQAGESASVGRADRTEQADRTDRADRVTALEAELAETETDLAAVEEERDDLRAERDRLREERDDLQEQVEDLEAERDDLQSEVERLESQLRQLEDEYGAATDAERRLSPAEALEGTNLFVRYGSKGEATLESAHDGNASKETVNDNLDLEYHTQFEADGVSVEGTSFEEYLHETIEYRFVSWAVYDLLYEIRNTGKTQALSDLYDAIPRFDRVDLGGTVTTEYIEDGQERRTQESFDVVLRDRLGNALVVANMNDSRQAASESTMNTLVTAASRVGESNDSLAAACLVTSSFFEPEALETAADATSGGLLSRDKRESFVKLSRKRGYHLCLAEAREGKFHLAVPEL